MVGARRCGAVQAPSMARIAQPAIRGTFGVAADHPRRPGPQGPVTSSPADLHLRAAASRRRSVRPASRTTPGLPGGLLAQPGPAGLEHDRTGASRAACRRLAGQPEPHRHPPRPAARALRRTSSPAPTASRTRSHGAPGPQSNAAETRRDRRSDGSAAGLLEAQKTWPPPHGGYRQLPILRKALQEHLRKAQADMALPLKPS